MRKPVALLLITAVILLITLPHGMDAQGTNHAALVIDFGNGNVETRCVDFTASPFTGYDLLVESGLAFEIDFAGSNGAICSIEGTGCPVSNCFCQCTNTNNCTYWTYWHRLNDEWAFSQVGAPLYPVGDGAVEGWKWGPASVAEAQPPPDLSFADVCQVGSPTNTPTVTNTPTATIRPTAIVIPTEQSSTAQPPTLSAASATPSPTPTGIAATATRFTATPLAASPTAAGSAATQSPTIEPFATAASDNEESLPVSSVATTNAIATAAEQETSQSAVGTNMNNDLATTLTPDVAAEALLLDAQAADSETVSTESVTTPIAIGDQEQAIASVSEPDQAVPTPSPQSQVTVIGALAAVPEVGEAAVPDEAATDTRTTQTATTATAWLPYAAFAFICLCLGGLLLLGRNRVQRRGSQGGPQGGSQSGSQ